MFGKKFTLFTLLDFDVSIDLSWVFLALLIVWSLATGVIPHYVTGRLLKAYWWQAITGTMGVFASIIKHEFCHSLIAMRFRLPMECITLFMGTSKYSVLL